MDRRREIKRIPLVFMAVWVLALSAACINGRAGAETAAQDPPADRVEVYYFHGNARCVSCLKIESYTREALREFFPEELDSGKIVFTAANVEQKGNGHFIREYGIYTKAVVVTLVKNGKEIKHNNLQKIWEYLWNGAKFREYIREEVGKYLEEAG